MALKWMRSVPVLEWHASWVLLFPAFWIGCVLFLGTISAVHHRRALLVCLAPAAVTYVLLAYAVWLAHGIKGLITGREPSRDKPTRYSHVVA